MQNSKFEVGTKVRITDDTLVDNENNKVFGLIVTVERPLDDADRAYFGEGFMTTLSNGDLAILLDTEVEAV